MPIRLAEQSRGLYALSCFHERHPLNTLIIPDLHAPFAHPDALDFLAEQKKAWKPSAVVCIGDLGDQHGWSRHERAPDAPGQGDEDRATVAFCRQLYKLFPVVSACVGNHDKRLAKRCVRAGVPSRLHRTVAEVYDSPAGWKWADGHKHGDVTFIHGEGYSGKDGVFKATQIHRGCVVMGHVHAWAGVCYHSNGTTTVWGLNVGCLVDPSSIAMDYAKTCPNRPTLGCGMVFDGVPCFIPLR